MCSRLCLCLCSCADTSPCVALLAVLVAGTAQVTSLEEKVSDLKDEEKRLEDKLAAIDKVCQPL